MNPRQVEMPIHEDEVIVGISAGGMHSACVTSSGECYTWGSSQYGQLGHGLAVVEKKTCSVPRKVMLPDVKQEGWEKGRLEIEGPEQPFIAESIACGGMHTAAVDKDGKLWCWGRADSGQTGQREWIFTFFSGLVVPHMVSDIDEKVTMVACGGWHTAAVTCSGKVYTMGKEDFGMLGTTVGSELLSHVKLIDSLLDKHFIGVSCGGWHTVMWTDDGEVFVCGKGEYGRLGLGHEASACEPVQVQFGEDVKVRSASAGGSHTLFLTRSHGVFSTGRTGEGRLAIGNVTCDRILIPTKVDLYSDHIIRDEEDVILQVSAGGGHSLITKACE
jgi:alpha-tubulin suppressor-like RCC1 family protein